MSITPKLRLALFGQSGAGKTTFFASYYGTLRSQHFEDEHGYRLAAKQAVDGNMLLNRFQAMERGEFPLATDVAKLHEFDVMIGSLTSPGMELSWLDYPGGWWERVPRDASERAERRNALLELTSSHAIVLLLDAARWNDEGRVYLKDTLHRFSNLIEEFRSDLANEGKSGLNIPQTMVLAISKADLLDNKETAETVTRRVLKDAPHEVQAIARSLGASEEKPVPFLSHVILLSSAQSDAEGKADVRHTMSLNLIAPIVLAALLGEVAQRAGKKRWYGYLAIILEGIASVIKAVGSVEERLPEKYKKLASILDPMISMISKGANTKAEDLRNVRKSSLERFDAISAVAASMVLELEKARNTRAYFLANG